MKKLFFVYGVCFGINVLECIGESAHVNAMSQDHLTKEQIDILNNFSNCFEDGAWIEPVSLGLFVPNTSDVVNACACYEGVGLTMDFLNILDENGNTATKISNFLIIYLRPEAFCNRIMTPGLSANRANVTFDKVRQVFADQIERIEKDELALKNQLDEKKVKLTQLIEIAKRKEILDNKKNELRNIDQISSSTRETLRALKKSSQEIKEQLKQIGSLDSSKRAQLEAKQEAITATIKELFDKEKQRRSYDFKWQIETLKLLNNQEEKGKVNPSMIDKFKNKISRLNDLLKKIHSVGTVDIDKETIYKIAAQDELKNKGRVKKLINAFKGANSDKEKIFVKAKYFLEHYQAMIRACEEVIEIKSLEKAIKKSDKEAEKKFNQKMNFLKREENAENIRAAVTAFDKQKELEDFFSIAFSDAKKTQENFIKEMKKVNGELEKVTKLQREIENFWGDNLVVFKNYRGRELHHHSFPQIKKSFKACCKARDKAHNEAYNFESTTTAIYQELQIREAELRLQFNALQQVAMDSIDNENSYHQKLKTINVEGASLIAEIENIQKRKTELEAKKKELDDNKSAQRELNANKLAQSEQINSELAQCDEQIRAMCQQSDSSTVEQFRQEVADLEQKYESTKAAKEKLVVKNAKIDIIKLQLANLNKNGRDAAISTFSEKNRDSIENIFDDLSIFYREMASYSKTSVELEKQIVDIETQLDEFDNKGNFISKTMRKFFFSRKRTELSTKLEELRGQKAQATERARQYRQKIEEHIDETLTTYFSDAAGLLETEDRNLLKFANTELQGLISDASASVPEENTILFFEPDAEYISATFVHNDYRRIHFRESRNEVR
ncbi:MAG: hypothetical protein LBJ71_02755 [Holosporaceae bacterium]|jgi:hypothetical protein|nr:hypothetical protein [Holosporaceae bacterium]